MNNLLLTYLIGLRKYGLPFFRMLAGVWVGKISLALDPNPVDALAWAAVTTIILGYFTSTWEE
jgi:TRAP-type mannitol/chloroaromatic compound transport system permease large subunit